MSIELTLASLVAILLLGWLAGRLFPVKHRLTAERVSRNMLRYEPDAQINGMSISEDGLTALVQLGRPEKTVGLLRQMGDRVVCRIVQHADIRKIYKDHARLTLTFHDFTQPEVTLVLTGQTLEDASELLTRLAPNEDAQHAA